MQIDSIAPKFDTNPLTRGIQSGEGAALPIPGSAPAEGAGKSFGQMLESAIADVNAAQLRSADLTGRFAAGEPLDVHQVMIASQEAGVALNLALQVRNKLVDAYQEVMRVNI
jgi:flagellar hook-basal body complex protein FliE